jgi:alanine-glyoxylate transaminase/serine-glyoxylate transaminase/serine-pyruvate transaminase
MECFLLRFRVAASGLGPMAGKIWRIGLMGHSSNPKNVKYCVSVLKTVLG